VVFYFAPNAKNALKTQIIRLQIRLQKHSEVYATELEIISHVFNILHFTFLLLNNSFINLKI